MSATQLRVLLVEDNQLQQRMIARYLRTLAEYEVAVVNVGSEEGAVETFGREPFDLVVLDYTLEQGDGLSCLKKLRARDRIVPIVAVSGMASDQVAAELVRAGADDYFSKMNLTPEGMAAGVRAALQRAGAVRQRRITPEGNQVEVRLREAATAFAARLTPDLLAAVDRVEAAAREADVTPAQLEELFRGLSETDSLSRPKALRPLLLELGYRLFGSATSPSHALR